MAAGYVSLPAFRAQSPIDWSQLGDAFDTIGKTLERNRLLQENRAIGEQLFSGAQGSPVQPQGQAPYQAPQNALLPSPGAAGLAANARDFIKREEGYAPQAKWDVRQNSGGYGSRSAAGETFTPEKAEAYLTRDMQPAEDWINKNVPNATPEQRTALHSFGYNLGVGALDNLKPQIQAGDWQGVAQRMQLYNKARVGPGGALQPLDGLTARRAREAALLTSGQPEQAPSQPSGPNYRAAAAVAARQGNVALASQLLQQQQDLDNQAYTRQRQSRLDARQEQQDNLSIDEKRRELQKQAVAKVASIATNVIQKEQDPERKQQMWTRLLAADPDMANDLRRYGVNPADIDGSIRALVAISGGGANKPIEVSPGATLYDPGSNQAVFTAPERASSANLPSGYRTTADGRGLEFIPGGPADPALKPKGRDKYTELQSKAANFGNMMVQAEKQLSATAPVDENGQRDVTKIENPKNVMGALRDGLLPFEGLRNTVTPNDTQAYNQLAKQWIRAKLRKESGAAIGNEEMEQEFRTYFPQYGDGPEVLKQKALARAEATKGMIAESGGAYQDLFQGAAGQQADPAPAQAAPEVRLAPRPNGISNETIIENAKKAIADGKDEAAVRQQLKAWEVPF